LDPAAAESLSWLLDQVDEAERVSLTQVFPLIYEDLRRVARRYMAQEKGSHTLQATALVHEAFVRIQEQGGHVHGQARVLALAALAMRHILVEHARRRAADKRGGGAQRISLQEEQTAGARDLEILELDELINRMAELDQRRARVVELRFFAGMSNEEIAAALGVARSTVAKDWSVARAWLRSELAERPAP
jgi:RNA polymerase sigma-70 factor (ECF subfamily)